MKITEPVGATAFRRNTLAKSIIPLFRRKKTNQYVPIGTSINGIITHPEGPSNWGLNRLITCKNVLEKSDDLLDPIFIRLAMSEGKGVKYFQLTGDVTFHKDPNVDLALLDFETKEQIDFKKTETIAVNLHTIIPTQQRLETLKTDLLIGDEVYIVGVLPTFLGYSENSVFWRQGIVSLLTAEETTGYYGPTQQMFIESLAYKSFIGSPVFIERADESGNSIEFLIAFISGTIPTTDYPMEINPNKFELVTNLGILTATPITKLTEIIWDKDFYPDPPDFSDSDSKN